MTEVFSKIFSKIVKVEFNNLERMLSNCGDETAGDDQSARGRDVVAPL